MDRRIDDVGPTKWKWGQKRDSTFIFRYLGTACDTLLYFQACPTQLL